LMSETLADVEKQLKQHIKHAEERDRETTEKLNALIALMDQHLRDHHQGRADASPSS
jgi:peptide deformylase